MFRPSRGASSTKSSAADRRGGEALAHREAYTETSLLFANELKAASRVEALGTRIGDHAQKRRACAESDTLGLPNEPPADP